MGQYRKCVLQEATNAKLFLFDDSEKRCVLVHTQSNRPLTGIEPQKIITWQFPLSENVAVFKKNPLDTKKLGHPPIPAL